MKNRKTIVTSSNEDLYDVHRSDFETCPHCDRKTERDDWDTASTVLILKPQNYKAGAVAILSECPLCFKKSWAHRSMDSFSSYKCFPKAWKDRVETLAEATKLEALRDWGTSICPTCKHLKSGTVEYHAWRYCAAGSGPAIKKNDKCNKYEPL